MHRNHGKENLYYVELDLDEGQKTIKMAVNSKSQASPRWHMQEPMVIQCCLVWEMAYSVKGRGLTKPDSQG